MNLMQAVVILQRAEDFPERQILEAWSTVATQDAQRRLGQEYVDRVSMLVECGLLDQNGEVTEAGERACLLD